MESIPMLVALAMGQSLCASSKVFNATISSLRAATCDVRASFSWE